MIEKLRRKLIKRFLDIFLLIELMDAPLSGYDLISIIHNKFNILVSSGTMYSLLYSLERDGLIQGSWEQRRRVYTLTDIGHKSLAVMDKATLEVREVLKDFQTVDTT